MLFARRGDVFKLIVCIATLNRRCVVRIHEVGEKTYSGGQWRALTQLRVQYHSLLDRYNKAP